MINIKPSAIVVDPALATLIGKCPATTGELRRAIKTRVDRASKADLEKRVYLRKYTGAGNIRGILDHVDDGTPTCSINSIPTTRAGNIVIASLNDDTVYPAEEMLMRSGVSVTPIVHPAVSAKHLREKIFPGRVPFSVYIPPGEFCRVREMNVPFIFSARGIETVMVKDDLGYHSGHVIPYIITPVSKLGDVLDRFIRQCERLYDPEGVIIDEFIGTEDSTIIKAHVFGEVIPGEVMQYRVKLRGLDGAFKSSDPRVPGLIESVDISGGTIDDETAKLINAAATDYFPLAMASVDMMIGNDGVPVIIDINGRAGSFGEMQERAKNNDHNPFDYIASAFTRMDSGTALAGLASFERASLLDSQ